VGVVPLIEMTVAQICTTVGYPAMSVLFGLTIFLGDDTISIECCRKMKFGVTVAMKY